MYAATRAAWTLCQDLALVLGVIMLAAPAAPGGSVRGVGGARLRGRRVLRESLRVYAQGRSCC